MGSTESMKERLLESLSKPVDDLGFDAPLGLQGVIGRLYRTVRNRLLSLFLERGVDTEGHVVELDHFHPDFVSYQPSHWFWLRRALRKLNVGPTDVFLDFGSGKGRIVLQAARYPFARVIGVEISEKLNRIARANVERNRQRLVCQSVELVTVDAAQFEVPDDVSIAYFYYPFAGETFRTVIANIVRSLDRSPRQVTLIYACPKLEDVILETKRFRRHSTVKGGRKDVLPWRVAIYVSEPPAGAGDKSMVRPQ
jgi:SAM-dependent methyltransferase